MALLELNPTETSETEVVEDQKPVDQVVTEENKEPEEGEQPEGEAEDEYYTDQVNKLHGFELPVELPEGVDPDSVDGLYHRDLALMAKTQEDFITSFKKQYPDAYRLAIHINAGGSLLDFERGETYPEFESIKDNLERQKAIYSQSLKEKGIDEDDIDALVNAKIKKEQLGTEVEKYLKAKEQERANQLEAIEQKANAVEKETNDAYAGLDGLIVDIYNTNTFPLFRIPDADLPKAYSNFVEHLQYDAKEKSFKYIVDITRDNITALMEADFIRKNHDKFKKTEDAKKQAVAKTLRDKNKALEKTTNVSVDKTNREVQEIAKYF